MDGGDAEKADLLEYHARLPLSGRFRSLGDVKYWAVAGSGGTGELWVRHRDVTVIQKRTAFPDFVKDDTRWLDISVVTGTLVAYQGKQATFATLLSVARELPASETMPAADGPRPIPLGTFSVRQKHLTFTGKQALGFGEPYELLDVPWTLELSSGQLLHGAYWHDRFGIEHGSGNLALSPADAARVFQLALPELPSGWHAIATRANDAVTPVVIRK